MLADCLADIKKELKKILNPKILSYPKDCSPRSLEGFRAYRVPNLAILGGSWVLISRVVSRVTILINHIRGLITLF